MECFVNLRMYDRERAHFTREGKYLALVKENLCERRFLHIVKANDPWTDNENAERTYEGVIHKALLKRILLKFDANFQQTYNYPDYCLEFYFSHYCYRKQHYANSRAAEKLGDQFLFPTLTQSRERPQLDIKLNDEENLLLRNWQCRWHNCVLNSIQKKYTTRRSFKHATRGFRTSRHRKNIPQIFKLIPTSACTPSNSSADVITTRLIESGVLKMGDFIRIVSQRQVEKQLTPEHLMPDN
uniref:Uncharacterized protein n=1 Tax=Glossina palpalis gambiensis TaxID=67801 RepID=A0A1B0BRU5_9MUSC